MGFGTTFKESYEYFEKGVYRFTETNLQGTITPEGINDSVVGRKDFRTVRDKGQRRNDKRIVNSGS